MKSPFDDCDGAELHRSRFIYADNDARGSPPTQPLVTVCIKIVFFYHVLQFIHCVIMWRLW